MVCVFVIIKVTIDALNEINNFWDIIDWSLID